MCLKQFKMFLCNVSSLSHHFSCIFFMNSKSQNLAITTAFFSFSQINYCCQNFMPLSSSVWLPEEWVVDYTSQILSSLNFCNMGIFSLWGNTIFTTFMLFLSWNVSSSPLPFIVMMVTYIPLSLSALLKVLLILANSVSKRLPRTNCELNMCPTLWAGHHDCTPGGGTWQMTFFPPTPSLTRDTFVTGLGRIIP